MRIVKFKKNDCLINYKTSMNENAESHQIVVQSKSIGNVPACYKSQLPISKIKLDDLLKLCTDNVIPQIFQGEYKSLKCASSIRDTLPESDVEDDDIN